MNLRHHTIRYVIATLLAIFLLTMYGYFPTREFHPAYRAMVEASATMHRAIQVIREERTLQDIPILSGLDPARTGFIGTEFTPITTTLGNLAAKQTSAQPDFAALLVRWLYELPLQPGDEVGIQCSGSFPALNIAAIVACETLGLQPVISASVGASSYGANLPGFTYPDMEQILFRRGIIHHRSELVTPGGNQDNGSSFYHTGMELVRQAVQRNGYPLTVPKDLTEAIQRKIALFTRQHRIRCFINIGGNQTALGEGTAAALLPGGVVRRHASSLQPNSGLIFYFLRRGIPVIHLLDIRGLASRYGLPIAPGRFIPPGLHLPYFRTRATRPLAIFSLMLLVLMMFFLKKTPS